MSETSAGSGAHIVGAYRYLLWRTLSTTESATVLFVMLNPSTADGVSDDPTLRRCIGFARSWGLGRLEVCNLFAYRTPTPRALQTERDPVGPLNDSVLASVAKRADLTVVAWGVAGRLRQRDDYVTRTLLEGRSLYCLGWTRTGAPRHPLYVPRTVELVRYR